MTRIRILENLISAWLLLLSVASLLGLLAVPAELTLILALTVISLYAADLSGVGRAAARRSTRKSRRAKPEAVESAPIEPLPAHQVELYAELIGVAPTVIDPEYRPPPPRGEAATRDPGLVGPEEMVTELDDPQHWCSPCRGYGHGAQYVPLPVGDDAAAWPVRKRTSCTCVLEPGKVCQNDAHE